MKTNLSRVLRCIRTYHATSVSELARCFAQQPDFADIFTDRSDAEIAEAAAILIDAMESAEHTPSLNILGVYSQVFDLPMYQILFFAENDDSSAVAGIRNFITDRLLKLLEYIAQDADLEACVGPYDKPAGGA